MNWKWLVIVVSFLTLQTEAVHQGVVRPLELKCEFRVNPIGIDTQRPRLSWTPWTKALDERQSAYRIQVATTGEDWAHPDLWDSREVKSEETTVVYGGRPLKPGKRVFWRVILWDRRGGELSSAATWEMGLADNWVASWISQPQKTSADPDPFDDHPAPLFRKSFTVKKKISRARLYVTGLGFYEANINGKRIGNSVLDPGWTDYSKRVLYATHDVTGELKSGNNAIGIMVGNGWFNPLPLKMWGHVNPRNALTIGEPCTLAQLVVEYTDGTSETIATDESWKVSDGPILRNSVYLGEVYDAQKEQAGWDTADFDDAKWQPVVIATNKLGRLCPQDAPPIRVTRTLKPVKVTEPKSGVHIFDFGQNFSGVVRLRVKGPAGTRVRLRSGELLYPDGTLNGMTAVCGQIKGGGKDYVYDGVGMPKTAFQLDEYLLNGDGVEEFTPRFTFHGFRYVEVTGFPGKPDENTLEGLRMNSDVEPVGTFSCSNEMFNRIQEMVLWTQLANMFSVQSDCPHREKFGYGGDLVAASEMGIYNFDMSRFYAKVVNDFADAVRPNGGFTETAPYVGIADEGLGDQSGPIGWGTAHPLLQWQLYQYYGDKRVLEEQFENTKHWIELLNSKAKDFILDNGISDHESLVPKPRALTGTAFYYFNVRLFAQITRALGRTADARDAEALADKIKLAFNARFLDRNTGKYDAGTQCCQAFALHFGLVPDDMKSRALDVLVRDIQETHKGHLSTGIFGTKYMLHALAEAGRADVAYDMVNQKTFPGWGHMLENGATTLWEHWAFSDNTFSHNHPMFGSVSEWFYKELAGIQPAPDAVGFDKIILHPHPVGDLKWVKATYKSIRGPIVSEWEKDDGAFRYAVIVPVQTTALVYVPATRREAVSFEAPNRSKAIQPTFMRMEGDTAVFSVSSGQYTFISK